MQEQAELIGFGRVAGSAVGGEVGLPRLDMIFRLSAHAIEPFVEFLGATALQIGDDEAGVGAVRAGFDARDDALDPAPALGGVIELREALYFAARRRS
jgi:hypothetical protein